MRWFVAGLAAVLAAVFVGAAGVGGALYWDRVQSSAEQSVRAELPDIAKQQIPAVFGYDYQTVERSLTDAYTLLTPAYRKEFEQRANADIIPQARQRQVVSQANVVGVGVMDAHRDSASVLVYLNRTVTDKSRQPLYDGSRLRVDYQKIGGRWLINYITPI
jgi:Mce-associated membrane protein